MPTITRISIALVCAAACGLAWSADGGAALPVAARVAVDHTYLRAGPSDDFYPTERLTGGAEVEVWAVDASGYCAVRPLPGSFSWLREIDVAAAGGIGVVVTDGAVARVGSQLNELRHVTQVALEAGERVSVLDIVEIPAGRHAGRWVKIEPPSGEFRWARGADLELPPAVAALLPPAALPEEVGETTTVGEALTALRDAGAAVQQAVARLDEPPPAGAAPAPTAAGNPVTKLLAGWLPLGARVFDPAAPQVPPAVAAPPGPVTPSADELADIDLALALAVSGPSESWNLAPIRERLRVASTRASSEADRGRAQAIDTRLSRFEAIQGRQAALVPPPTDETPLRLGSMWSSLSALGTRPIRPGVMPGGAPAGGQPTWTPPDQVETTGRLAAVVSRRPDAPRWALVDDHNNVLVFVTPQPGVNLAPLVGQQIVVRGARGYMPEYKRSYVVAAEARTRIASVPPPSGGDRTQ